MPRVTQVSGAVMSGCHYECHLLSASPRWQAACHLAGSSTHGVALQVELNTIAASFACLSTITTQLHQHILGRLRGTAAAAATKSSASTGTSGLSEAAAAAAGLLSGHRLPSNAAMQVRLGQSWCWRL